MCDNCCDDMQSEPVRRLEDEINLRYGHYLFGKGEYDEGLAQMGMSSSSNPVMLLHLFPSLASPNLLQPVSHLLPGSLHLQHAFCSTLSVTWDFWAVQFLQRGSATWLLQYGLCSALSASVHPTLCFLQHGFCGTFSVTCLLHHRTCGTVSAAYFLQLGSYSRAHLNCKPAEHI